MKNILFLINSLGIGGAEHILADTANVLHSAGYDVTVQTVTDGGIYRGYLDGGVHYKSIINVKSMFLRRAFAYFVNFILPPKLVYRLFIKGSYDYEVAFLEGVPTKLISASNNKKAKKYAWVHIDLVKTFGLNKVFPDMKKHIECYKKFDKIVCVSEAAKQAFSEKFGITDNICVKYNILDENAIIKKSSEDKFSFSQKTVFSVGRLEKQKGFDRLIKIFKRLVDDGCECNLCIVGDGTQYNELNNLIIKHNLKERVQLMGYTDNPYKYMNAADVVVFPSRAEGFSTVATEAIILGKPVVASNCAGMKEIFGDSEFGIVTENDDDEIYKGLKKMIFNADIREHYIKMARVRAESFTMQNRLNELIKLFE